MTTDANTHLAMFANGETAMMQEGNWAQTLIDNITPDMNIGMFPMPINDDAEKNDKLTVGIPANLVVNKESGSKEEAKTFLNWLVTSDMGKEYITKNGNSSLPCPQSKLLRKISVCWVRMYGNMYRMAKCTVCNPLNSLMA